MDFAGFATKNTAYFLIFDEIFLLGLLAKAGHSVQVHQIPLLRMIKRKGRICKYQ